MTSNQNYVTQEETLKSIRNASVQIEDEAITLVFDRIVASYSVTRKVDPISGKQEETIRSRKLIRPEEKEHVILPLREVSLEQIEKIRRCRIPSFLYKYNGKFFYTKIAKKSIIHLKDVEHCCSTQHHMCIHLSPLRDEEGGCQKVRDIGRKKRIEKYPWITEGYETFNLSGGDEQFIVIKCEHFE